MNSPTTTKRLPRPGKPRVIAGSSWLNQDETLNRYQGNNSFSRYQRYQPRYSRQRYSKEHYRKQQGLEGERYVLDRILSLLDERWTVYTNLELFERQGDIDIALVGPGGIVALEVKNYRRDDLLVVQDDWMVMEGETPVTYDKQPSAQAKGNAWKMELYLEANDLDFVRVRPIVVVASDTDISVYGSEIEVWSKEELDRQLEQLNVQAALSEEQIARIVEGLPK